MPPALRVVMTCKKFPGCWVENNRRGKPRGGQGIYPAYKDYLRSLSRISPIEIQKRNRDVGLKVHQPSLQVLLRSLNRMSPIVI